jgi:competence protein ComEC
MATGIVAYFARHTEPFLAPPVCLAAASLGLAARLPHRRGIRALLLAAGFAAAGFAAARLAAGRAAPWPDLPRTATIVTGTIAQIDLLPEGRRITIATPVLDGGAPLARTVRLRLRDTDATPLASGDAIRLRALLRAPSPPSYPGGWDMQRDAWFAGMAGYGFAIGPVSRLAHGNASHLQTLRESIAGRLIADLPGPRGAIAATLLTGLGAAIPAADRAAFQVSGLAHLLAVAGLHIGIVMGLVFATTRTVLCACEHAALHWPVKHIAALAALAAGLFYLTLTGAHIPILRSFAMAGLVTLALLTGRRALSVRALALAALVLMVCAPEIVMGVSFQMSFAAVLALVAGWEVLSPRMALLGAGKWWRVPVLYVCGLAVTSALAGTASLPYAAYHFGTATLFYVPANMLAVPLTALWVMPWGLGALLFMPIGLEHLCTTPMGWGIAGLLAIAHGVAAWPDAAWPIPQMPSAGLVALSAGLASLCIWRSLARLAGLLPIAAGLLSPWLATAPDIVVSPDARIIAARLGRQAFVSSETGASRFDRDIPARVWGIAAATDFPNCAAGACRLAVRGIPVRLITDAAAPCGNAAIILAAMPLRGACPAAVVVDRFSVLDAGATAIYIGPDGAIVRTDRDGRGDRPWVIAPRAHMATSSLPPALTE